MAEPFVTSSVGKSVTSIDQPKHRLGRRLARHKLAEPGNILSVDWHRLKKAEPNNRLERRLASP